MGFLNVYNNFKDFNAHLSHAFKVTFFNNIQTNDENAASFSVKSVTKPVFKLSTEEYTRELGNSRFVIPIIDFSSAHMSITFYESDNMGVQAYLSSIYGSIGTVPPPIKILLEEYDNSMCIRLSSKVYLARLIELSLPGFNNDGPGSIQEITAEFNVMRVYDNLPDLTAPVDLKYKYNDDYKFTYKDTDFYIKKTTALKPSDIKIDNLTFTQEKWKKLQITKRKLVSDYETKISELNTLLAKELAMFPFMDIVDGKIAASGREPLEQARAAKMLTNILVNEDGSVDTLNELDQWTHFDSLDALFVYITTRPWNGTLGTSEGIGINTITREEFDLYVYFSAVEREIKQLKTELRNQSGILNEKQVTIEGLKSDQDVIKFVNEHQEYKDEELHLTPIPGEQGGSGQGGSAPAPAAPRPVGAGIPPVPPPVLPAENTLLGKIIKEVKGNEFELYGYMQLFGILKGGKEGDPKRLYFLNGYDQGSQSGKLNFGGGLTYDAAKGANVKITLVRRGDPSTILRINNKTSYTVAEVQTYANQHPLEFDDTGSRGSATRGKWDISDQSAFLLHTTVAKSYSRVFESLDDEIVAALNPYTIGGLYHVSYGLPQAARETVEWLNRNKTIVLEELQYNNGTFSESWAIEHGLVNVGASKWNNTSDGRYKWRLRRSYHYIKNGELAHDRDPNGGSKLQPKIRR